MAKRPAFQFYPADWRNNANLRRCSEAARGAWMDVLCLLHDSDEYGVLRWPLADIAQAAGLPLKLLQELARKSVLKGADSGAADYTWAPSHAGKAGEPVTLVAAGDGPCWYCSRFVKDEYIRQRRGTGTRFSDDNPPPKAKPKSTPKVGFGDGEGYGASSSSSSTTKSTVANATGADAPPDPIWGTGLAFLVRKGIPAAQARPFLGKLRKQAGDVQAAAILADAEAQDITDPIPWLSRAAMNARASPPTGKPSAAADFRGKTYDATPLDQLPPDLRAAAEAALRDG